MTKASGRGPTWGIENHFQIVMRLQLVRRLVNEASDRGIPPNLRRGEAEEILRAIQSVANVAGGVGLHGFASVGLSVCQRIEPLVRNGDLPLMTLQLLGEWAANSELYLRRPRRREFATAVLKQLNDLQWHRPLDSVELASLLHGMLEPFD
jgi:hypothetical protein